MGDASLSGPEYWNDTGQLEDPGRRQVLLGDADAEIGQGVLDGIGQGGRRADHPALADPPVVGEHVGRGLDVVDLDLGDLHGGGDQVVHEGPGLELALVVVGRLLVQDGAHPLGHPAPDLPVHDGGVDDLAAVLHHDVAGDLHQTAVEVDLHHADVRGPG